MLLSSSASAIAVAAPPSVRLTYGRAADLERCPDEEAIRQGIASRLGYDPVREPATLWVRILISRAKGSFAGTLELLKPTGEKLGSRVNNSPDCRELAEVLTLVASLAIDPTLVSRPAPVAKPLPPPSPRTPVTVPAPAQPMKETSPAERWRWSLAAAVGAGFGMEPSPAITFGFEVSVRRARFSFALEGHAGLAHVSTLAGTDVETQQMRAAWGGCFHVDPFGFCALVTAGSLRSYAGQLAQARSQVAPWGAAGLRVALERLVFEHLLLRLQLEGQVPFARVTLLVDERPAWSTPAVIGALQAIAGVRF